MILHDLYCPTCSESMPDTMLESKWLDGTLVHFPCGTALQIVSGTRHHASIHASELCVVFRNAAGEIHYPGRNDVAPPTGYERVELRSFKEVEQFSRDHGCRNEIEGFDQRGTGRGFEYDGNPVLPPQWKEQIRWQE